MLITRRKALIGGAALCACTATGLRGQSINSYSETGGCWLSEDEASNLMPDASPIVSYMTGNEPIIPKSGNANFDRALAISLSRMTKIFGVLPGFGYYHEEDGDGMNAYATPKVRMSRDDGTVLVGTKLLFALLAKPEAPDAAIMAVCSHEYGHIVQNKLGIRDKLLSGQPTVKRLELHADFIAGYFAGRRKSENENFAAAVFAKTQYSFGDTSSGRGHHGTPDERAAAVVAGYEAARTKRLNFDDAVAAGIGYVGA
jgi:hypothetical protein